MNILEIKDLFFKSIQIWCSIGSFILIAICCFYIGAYDLFNNQKLILLWIAISQNLIIDNIQKLDLS